MTKRLRRSFLYTPGNDVDMMEKAADLDAADAVIFDLEDAVPDDDVPTARENIDTVLGQTDFGDTEVCVRINGLQTRRWEADLRSAVRAGVDTIVLPMVERTRHLDAAVAVAEEVAESTDHLVPEFIATIETPRGLFDAREIAEHGGEIDYVTGFSYGFGDYTRAIGATGRPEQMHEFIRHIVVSAAAVGGLDPLASVYQDFSDMDGLREQAASLHAVGYIGQKAIHPAQLETINGMYTPTENDVEQARQFVTAFDQADRDSMVVDGVFLDTAIVEQYRTVLQRHEEVAG